MHYTNEKNGNFQLILSFTLIHFHHIFTLLNPASNSERIAVSSRSNTLEKKVEDSLCCGESLIGLFFRGFGKTNLLLFHHSDHCCMLVSFRISQRPKCR